MGRKRNGLSKRLRFDVFKRDAFTCQYCGRTPPAVVLVVDHVVPVAEGGVDEISNLLTACFDCNSGKGAVPLSVVPKAFSEQRELAEEAEEQIRAYKRFLKRRYSRIQSDVEQVAQCFNGLYPDRSLTERFKSVSIKRFLKDFLAEELCEFLELAFSRLRNDDDPPNPDSVVRYFCGICWRRIKERDDSNG